MDKIATPYIWIRKVLFPLEPFTDLLQSGMAKLSGCHLHCYSGLVQASLSDLQRQSMCSLKCVISQAIRLPYKKSMVLGPCLSLNIQKNLKAIQGFLACHAIVKEFSDFISLAIVAESLFSKAS